MSKKKKHPSFERKSAHRRVPAERMRRRRPRVMPIGVSSALSEGDFEALKTYLDAHLLLPFDFEGDRPSAFPFIQEAFSVVEDGDASADALLRAVVVLGHTPTIAALDVLKRHASSGRPHADVARFAADECVDWIAHANTSPSLMN